MDARSCRSQGKEALRYGGYSTKKLIFIHTGAMLGLGVLVSLVSLLLDRSIESTGGLSGLGNRAILSTAQNLLLLANTVVAPFWQIGLVKAALKLVRGEEYGPRDLLEGFRRFGAVLRANILRGLICFSALMIAMQLAGTVFMMTPFAAELYALTEQMTATGITDMSLLMTPEQALSLFWKMLPFVLGFCLLLLLPLSYRLRMMDYVLMDIPGAGAFFSVRASVQLMRKNAWKLFRLDLSYWWFYALEVLTAAVCYGDMLLKLLGVQLPVSESVASYGFYLLGLLCQLGLYLWKKDALAAGYACAYEELLPKPAEE